MMIVNSKSILHFFIAFFAIIQLMLIVVQQCERLKHATFTSVSLDFMTNKNCEVIS